MSSGLRIVATGGMYGIGVVPKAGCIDGMTDTTPGINAYTFSGATFSWLCSRPASLLSWRSRPLLVLLNVGRCECLWRDLALLLFVGEGFGKLYEDNSSSAGVSASSGTMGFFPLSRMIGCFAYPLSCASPSPRLCLFSTWARRRSFSCCRCSMQSYNSLICLACSSCFFFHVLSPMKELVFKYLNHQIS